MIKPRSLRLGKCFSQSGRCLSVFLLVACLLAKVSGISAAAFLAHQANHLFAGTGTDLTTATAAGPDGSAFFTGTFIGTISSSSGSISSNSGGLPDIFLTKLLPDGNTAWLLRLGGTSAEKAECVSTDPANGRVYVGGQFAGTASFGNTNLTAVAGNDGFIACYEADGNFVWVRQIGGSGDESVFDIKKAADGLHVCGSYTASGSWGATTFSSTGGARWMFTVRADADGIPQAGIYTSSTQSIQPKSIVVLTDGARVIAGTFTGTLLLPGSVFRDSNGVDDFFAIAFESNGSMRWVITGGGTGNDGANSLIISAAGDLLIGNSVGGGGQVTDANGTQSISLASTGMLVARVSSAGVYTPLKSVAGPQLAGLAEGTRGVLHVAANFSAAVTLETTTVNPPGNQSSVFIASYLTTGDLAGVATVSGVGACSALDMAITSVDGIALAGLSTGNLKYAEQTLATGNVGLDAFTLLLAPPALRLDIALQSAQVRLTYPAYFYDASIWANTTVNSGSWTQIGSASTLTVGGMQQDLGATDAMRFYQLRWLNP